VGVVQKFVISIRDVKVGDVVDLDFFKDTHYFCFMMMREKERKISEIVWSIDSELRKTGIGLIHGGFGFGCLQASPPLPASRLATRH
jgi:hypothetical protein